MTRPTSERVELSMDTLEAILEQARSTPLSEAHYQQLKGVLNTSLRTSVPPSSVCATSCLAPRARRQRIS